MNEINYSEQMRLYLESVSLSEETLNRLVDVLPNITITLERETDKLSPKKSMERIKFI